MPEISGERQSLYLTSEDVLERFERWLSALGEQSRSSFLKRRISSEYANCNMDGPKARGKNCLAMINCLTKELVPN